MPLKTVMNHVGENVKYARNKAKIMRIQIFHFLKIFLMLL